MNDEEWRANGWTKLDSQEDAKEILNLLDAQEDFYVVHIRRFIFGMDFIGVFEADTCSECEADLMIGNETHAFAEPFGDTPEKVKASKYAAVHLFCCEEHAETYTDRWVGEIGFEEHCTAFHS